MGPRPRVCATPLNPGAAAHEPLPGDVELEELKEQLAAMQSQLAKLVKEG
jgi:hypothetical protein